MFLLAVVIVNSLLHHTTTLCLPTYRISALLEIESSNLSFEVGSWKLETRKDRAKKKKYSLAIKDNNKQNRQTFC